MSFIGQIKRLMKEFRYPFGNPSEDYLITDRELEALKNVLLLARERIWLGESYPKKPDYDTTFNEEIEDDSLEHARVSIQTLEDVVYLQQQRLREELQFRIQCEQ